MLLDKDLLDPSIFSSEDKKEENRKESGSCDDDCFNKFYDQLTARKDDKVSKTILKFGQAGLKLSKSQKYCLGVFFKFDEDSKNYFLSNLGLCFRTKYCII